MAYAGYDAARTLNRVDGHTSGGLQSGAYHESIYRDQLLSQSREFYRNNMLYKGIIDRCVNYVIGGGFGVQFRTSDQAWNEKAESLWEDYWRRPERRGILPGPRVERLVLQERLIAGDVLALLLSSGLIQLVESEQIRGPDYKTSGITTDGFGKPVSFRLVPYSDFGHLEYGSGKDHKAEDVLFVVDPERPSSLRGVPACQSAFPMLHRINDVCDSEAVAWQLLSRLPISRTRVNGPELAFGDSTADPQSDDFRVTDLDYAMIFEGAPGDEIRAIDRNIPGRDFPQSLTMFMRLLGLPLGLPLEIVLLDWTKSNYSQSRAVLEQAFQTFESHQLVQEMLFLRPLITWRVQKWIDSGELSPNPEAFNPKKLELLPPTWPWIDQLKEVQAHTEKVERGFITHSQVCKALHRDRDELMEQRQREVMDAIERAKLIEATTGVKVPWEIFAGVSVQSGKVNAAALPVEPEEEAVQEND